MTASNNLGLITFIKYGVGSVMLLPGRERVNIILPNSNYQVGDVCSLCYDTHNELQIRQ
ncbi:hypothetical protein [uncultured Limosilactobacillus sp.]|uniref:hypothetical protein n=1 Tax=uncultured Limosilactobacillus sp. TaxID=2837629 RepID=UPI0025EDBCD6|nr:hypothetical protein [uncultured Limosilactobacillus sp.]